MLVLDFRHTRLPRVAMIALVLLAVATAATLKVENTEAVACTDATISGSYGLRGSGAAVNPNGSHTDLVFIGRTTYDGHGHISGVERASVEGTVESVESLSGTYNVLADCTGSETFTFADTGQIVHADLVIVNQGNGIMFLDTDPGTLLTVRAVRQ
jgi:hypothetical protein